MPALREIQQAFLNDIYANSQTSAPYLSRERNFADRLHIYSNNAFLGLRDVLANVYPVIVKIVGDDFFTAMARHYLEAHRQHSGNRNTFGAALPQFLNAYEPAASLPYLVDVAGIEWAYFQAAFADDAQPLDFEGLTTALSCEPDFILPLHPAVHIVQQTFTALAVWQAHQQPEVGALHLSWEPHQLMVWRAPDHAVLIRPASHAMAAVIRQSRQGCSFAEAMTAASEHFDTIEKFQQEFAEAVHLGVFAQPVKEPSS